MTSIVRFIGTVIGLGTQSLSPELSYENLKKLGWHVLDKGRYYEILRYIRAYHADNREGSWDGGWLAQGDLTTNFGEIEELLLKESRRLFFHPASSCLVIDDELISCRAKDVQVRR
jgi:hypothetical protein